MDEVVWTIGVQIERGVETNYEQAFIEGGGGGGGGGGLKATQ